MFLLSLLPVEKNLKCLLIFVFQSDLSVNDFWFLSCKPARGFILAEFCHSLTYFRANLSSLIKASIVVLRVSFLQGISINLERNALKAKNRGYSLV